MSASSKSWAVHLSLIAINAVLTSLAHAYGESHALTGLDYLVAAQGAVFQLVSALSGSPLDVRSPGALTRATDR